jgi:hypothetical protein
MLSLLAMLCKMTDRRKRLDPPTSNPCPLVAMPSTVTNRRKRLNPPTSNPCPLVAMLCKMTARRELVAPTDRHGRTRLNPCVHSQPAKSCCLKNMPFQVMKWRDWNPCGARVHQPTTRRKRTRLNPLVPSLVPMPSTVTAIIF